MFSIKSLRAKTVLSALIPTALVMVLVAIIGLYAYERAARDVVQQRDTELVRISAARLSEALSRYSRVLLSVAAEDDLQSLEPARLSSALEEAQNRLYVFDAGVAVYNGEGIALWSQPFAEARRGTDFPLPSEFDKVRRTLRPVFSNVFRDAISGEEVILVAVPIVGNDGGFRGVLSGLFKMKYPLLGPIYAEVLQLKVGRRGYAYLVDGNGRVIYHPDGSRVGKNLAATLPVMRAIREETGAVFTKDVAGERVISGFAPVPGTGWGLITEERWGDVVGPIRGYGKLLLGLLVAGGVISGGVIFFSIGRILRPIRDLTQGAQRIAGGDFDHTISAKSGDEIEALARQFNTMAQALKESYRDLEQKVAARTRELSTLNTILSTIAGASELLEMDVVLEDTIAELYELLNLDAVALLLLDPQRGCLNLAVSWGLSKGFAQEEATVQVGECLCGLVAQDERPLVIDDLAAAEGLIRKACMEEDLRSMAVIPLLSRRRLMGILLAASRTARRFVPAEVELLTSAGHHIAVALENTQLYRQEQRRAEQFRVINELGRSISSVLDLDELLWAVVRLVKETFSYYNVNIFLVDPETDELVLKAGVGGYVTGAPSLGDRLKIGREGILGWIAATGEPLLVNDVSRETRYYPTPTLPRTRSELGVPIKARGQVVGTLDVQSTELNAFDQDDLTTLQTMADQIGVAIENARLYEQAQRSAVLEERGRLARELHDSVTQSLYSVTLFAEAARRLAAAKELERTESYLQQLGETAQQALKEMRLLVYELRPSRLEEEGLVGALRERLSTVEQRAGVEARLLVEGMEGLNLPKAVEEGLYRIAQEALNNALKHAKASSVTVRIRPIEADVVELEIADDGKGFDPEAVGDQGGMGLVNMRERAERLGGTLQIISAPGEGTRVRVRVGLD